MSRADTNQLIKPKWQESPNNEEQQFEHASGIGQVGPRVRLISKDDDVLLIRDESYVSKQSTPTPLPVDFSKSRPTDNIFLESSAE